MDKVHRIGGFMNMKCCPDHWLDWLRSPVDGEADADMREVKK